MQFGLVAKDVEEVNPDMVVRDNEGLPYSVRYDAVNAMLLNEFLKEHRRVEQLEKEVENLTTGLQKVSAQLEASKPAPQRGQQSLRPVGVWDCVSAADSYGRMIWIADAHRDDGKRLLRWHR